MPVILAGLLAKLAGLGAVAKAAIATATAALTIAVGGATGVLPIPGGGPEPASIAQGAIAQANAAVSSATSSLPAPTPGVTGVQAASAASATPPAASTSAKASTAVATPKVTPSANVPNVSVPAIPAIPSCVANLIPSGTTVPDPAKLVAQLPACIASVVTASLPLDTIQSVIGSAKLPVDVSKCLSSVVRSVPTFVSGNLSGLPQLLSACLPAGSIPGTGSIPGMSTSR